MSIGPIWLGWHRISCELSASGKFSPFDIEMCRLMFMWGAWNMIRAVANGAVTTESASAEMQEFRDHVKNYPMDRKARRRPELRVLDGGGDDKAERKSALPAEI